MLDLNNSTQRVLQIPPIHRLEINNIGARSLPPLDLARGAPPDQREMLKVGQACPIFDNLKTGGEFHYSAVYPPPSVEINVYFPAH